MKFIVDNDSRLYVQRFSQYVDKPLDENSYIIWTLVPVAIHDYIDPDYSDAQGWLQEIPHTGKIDMEEIVQYVYTESFKEALEDSGYAFIDVNTVYIWDETSERPVRDTAETAVANALDLW